MLRTQRYTFAEQLQRAAGWSLHRGHANDDGRPVLGRLLVDERPSPERIAQLRHEYAIASELELEGGLEPLALEDHGHGLVLVWRDPGGAPLRSLVSVGPVELSLAMKIGASLARTLAQVHERGVIHKKLAPESVMVDADSGRTWLFGFGVATRLTRETPQPAGIDELDSSLAYISPEQTGRMNRIVDRRSDLYSLGVLLYHLVTGTLPFASSDAMELLYCHLARQPEAPHLRVAEVPKPLSRLIVKLLAKNAEDRYQHARSVAEDLELCLEMLAERASIANFPLARGDRDQPALAERECHVLGSLCTPHDVWGYSYYGADIQPGDVLLIPTQGAYTYSLRQHFIKPLPKVVVVRGGGQRS